MYLGRIVEMTDKTSLFETPLHPYTEALLSAVPIPKYGAKGRKRVILTGDVPSPINPPPGCHFHTRCPYAMARCRHEAPVLREVHAGPLGLLPPARCRCAVTRWRSRPGCRRRCGRVERMQEFGSPCYVSALAGRSVGHAQRQPS